MNRISLGKVVINLIIILFSIIISIILSEIILRIHNPFPSRIKSHRLYLPVNTKAVFVNVRIPKLDKEIINTKNALGFRGEELPVHFEKHLSIIAIGGSTTACTFLSDNKHWPYLLGEKLKHSYENIWLNNAGIDGHSTFGHTLLLEDYIIKLKPKVVLLMTGRNDMGAFEFNMWDVTNLRSNFASCREFLLKNSELVSSILNFRKLLKARRLGFGHSQLELEKLHSISDTVMSIEEKELLDKYLFSYKQRLLSIINICKDSNIEPIFITQTMVFGKGTDPLTGVNLETVQVEPRAVINGKTYWKNLQMFNDVVRQVGKEAGIYVVDLANLMPKNSSYFYDTVHFTNEGAERAADIIYNELKQYFNIKYKEFIKN